MIQVNKLWLWIQRGLYRAMRNNLVHRMRANGATWVQINKVLNATGQKHIVKVELTDEGPMVDFAHPEYEQKPLYKKGVFVGTREVYKQAEVLDKRTKKQTP